MRILSVVGTRPQLIKAAALQPALRARHHEVFVDTGQHWDDAMAGSFFGELGLARPDHGLGIGGGGRADQIGRMLTALVPVVEAEAPDAILVYGDTNSTLAGALAGAAAGIPVAHVEAGLRSFDRSMPEEVNRVVADHLSAWLFAPTPTAVANLRAEGIVDGVVPVGDLMQDLAARVVREVRDPAVLGPIARSLSAEAPGLAPGSGGASAPASGPASGFALVPGGYVLATVHRAENRDPAAVAGWLSILAAAALGGSRPVLLPLHPGTREAVEAAHAPIPDGVVVLPPLGYRTTLALQLHAAAVLTDSGGVQREAAWLGTPCLVLRRATEWVEAVAGSGGSMVVVGLDAARAADELARLAPPDAAPALAAARAGAVDLRPAGAAEAIAAALDGPPPAPRAADGGAGAR
ncbi:MAG: UDP-N-acetylglucosamine 2-epimerase (non-hydrolyzing) [Chloroflexi bacterium]|nr:UDP-N-acetylglucosamine 2-epimerase (non-hydrolyzing) [Chloroflexota bacterium]